MNAPILNILSFFLYREIPKEEDNKENKVKNQNSDGIIPGSAANKIVDQVTIAPSVSSTKSPEIPSRKETTKNTGKNVSTNAVAAEKNVTKVAKIVTNAADKTVTVTRVDEEAGEKIAAAETISVTKGDKSVTNDTSSKTVVTSKVGTSVTNICRSVTNVSKSVTNVSKSVTNVTQKVTSPSSNVTTVKPNNTLTSQNNKPEIHQLTGSKQTAENHQDNNKKTNSKSCEVNNGLSVSTILDPEQEADRIFAQFKQRKRLFKRNLIIEGSCNYFFWMDKIAMVSSRKQFTSHVALSFHFLHAD